jgi:hypothetical protein
MAQVHHWHVVVTAARDKLAGFKAHLRMGDEIVSVDDVYVPNRYHGPDKTRRSRHSSIANHKQLPIFYNSPALGTQYIFASEVFDHLCRISLHR